MSEVVFNSELKSLKLIQRGKVRDIYALDDSKMLFMATDRLSAFDVVLPTPIPGKGKVLTGMSNFWFERTGHIVGNHLTGIDPATMVAADERAQVSGRAVVVRKLKPLPVEAIVRGYIVGSGWKEYKTSGTVCSMPLPAGLREADKLPQPIFTPSTKADVGDHDENISFERMVELVGRELAEQVRDVAIRLYVFAAEYALTKGIIIADTKFEFGQDEAGNLVLMDEVLTPDSSRFWPVESYAPGANPPSFDKQYVRDYLESLGWNKKPPAPELPAEVVEKTVERYRQALRQLTGGDIE
ncbi:MAG: phosphoribosylaminoimidazolesuccinocarboxamide synthase [Gammaproteobacteria bacterium HGW-Gammaproteobacteria-1]|jgi:phosphoribosylaminoimidazole-succinocarboxamide synthase|nr:MAG: phosphoribosylaminoimidazolesuccinocarboxamide synthase [Gammaproteobacteria bacterium HGW-Gammaproteobacteria-1]